MQIQIQITNRIFCTKAKHKSWSCTRGVLDRPAPAKQLAKHCKYADSAITTITNTRPGKMTEILLTFFENLIDMSRWDYLEPEISKEIFCV